MTDNNNRSTLKEAFDAELMKRLEENPPEIPTYEEFSAMVDKSLAERCRRRKRIAGIAAGFVVVLLAGILACTNLTADVDADKNPKEEIITEDGVIIEDGGWGSSDGEDNVWSTTEWEHVNDAKVVEPRLIVPHYVPERFVFKQLTVEQFAEVDSTSEYSFVGNKKDVLEIEVTIQRSDLTTIKIGNVLREIQSKNGTIYIQENGKKATIQIDDGIIVNIWGDLTDTEFKKIVEEIV